MRNRPYLRGEVLSGIVDTSCRRFDVLKPRDDGPRIQADPAGHRLYEDGIVGQRECDLVAGLDVEVVSQRLGDDDLTLGAYPRSHTVEFNRAASASTRQAARPGLPRRWPQDNLRPRLIVNSVAVTTSSVVTNAKFGGTARSSGYLGVVASSVTRNT